MASLSLAVSLTILVIWPNASVPLWAVPLALVAVAWGVGSDTLDGTYSLRMGELAERWTASELTSLREQGADSIDHLPFEHFDIDHVLVHPSGVFVVETKYTDREVDLERGTPKGMLSDWRGDALRAKDKIESLLVRAERVWIRPSAIVAIWGSEIVGASRIEDGVLLARGSSLVEVLAKHLGPPVLDLPKQSRIVEALEDFNTRRDSFETQARHADARRERQHR